MLILVKKADIVSDCDSHIQNAKDKLDYLKQTCANNDDFFVTETTQAKAARMLKETSYVSCRNIIMVKM